MENDQKIISLPSGNLAYLEAGEGEPLLFLHGFPDTPKSFSAQIAFFSEKGFRCLAPYLPGYGNSDLPKEGGASLGAVAEMMEQFLRATLGEGEKPFVVGHDWGSAIAQLLGIRQNPPVKALVLAAVPPARTLMAHFSLSQLWHSRYMFAFQFPFAAKRLRQQSLSYIRTLWRRWSPALPSDHPQLQETIELLMQPGCLEKAILYYRYAINPFYFFQGQAPKETLREFLQRQKVPGLVAWGKDDGCMVEKTFTGSLEAFSHPLSDVLPMAGAGHFLHIEAPEPFNEALLDFFTRVQRLPG